MEDQTTPYRLQHVELKYVSNFDCTSDPYDYPFGSITDEMMCARDNGSKLQSRFTLHFYFDNYYMF